MMSLFIVTLALLAQCGAARFIHLESDGASETAPSSPELPTGYDSTRMIVNYRNGKGKAAARAAASSVHLDLANYNAMAVSIPKEALQGLMNNPNIENVEMDAPRYFASHQHKFLRQHQTHHSHVDKDVDVVEQQHGHRKLAQVTPYGITMVQADQISDIAANAKKICIIDSGYSLKHPDLPKSPEFDVTGYGAISHWGSDLCSHGR
jgi:serine protease